MTLSILVDHHDDARLPCLVMSSCISTLLHRNRSSYKRVCANRAAIRRGQTSNKVNCKVRQRSTRTVLYTWPQTTAISEKLHQPEPSLHVQSPGARVHQAFQPNQDQDIRPSAKSGSRHSPARRRSEEPTPEAFQNKSGNSRNLRQIL